MEAGVSAVFNTVHARDGWQFVGDEQRWFLIKQFGDRTAHIRGIGDAETCSWNLVSADNRLLAGTSELDVPDAKAAIAHWLRENP